jgi:glutathione S-transferase
LNPKYNDHEYRSNAVSEKHLRLYVDSKFTSPYAMSVFVTLTEKSLPFDVHPIDLNANEHYATDYADLSLTCRVPTLTHGEFHLSESAAIDEYLEEAFPPPDYAAVYPRDIHDRARARQIQAWLRSDLMPIREERSTESIFITRIDNPLSADGQAAAKKIFAMADRLLKDDAPNLFATWCIADTDLALMLNRLVLNGDPVPPKLATYAQHQWQRSSVQAWVKHDRAQVG